MNRSDFPIFINHPELVYLDNAATSHKPKAVINAVQDFYESYNANVHRGIYKLSETATEMYEQARLTVADFLNAKSNEIIFTSGTTDSINQITYALALSLLKMRTGQIATSKIEHHSNFLPIQRLAQSTDSKLLFIETTENYMLDLEDLKTKLHRHKISLLAITHVSNVIGAVNPLLEICKLVREVSPETLILVDAAQSIPHRKVDLQELDVDFLAFSGHKLLAPTGIGVLYINERHLEKLAPAKVGGGMINKVETYKSTWTSGAEKFEAGTPNISGAIGLAAAINYLNTIGMNVIQDYEEQLTSYLVEELQKVLDLELYWSGDLATQSGTVSFNLRNIHAHDLAQILDSKNIAIRAGHHCNQLFIREILGVPATARASLHFYNTKEDIDKLCAALADARAMIS